MSLSTLQSTSNATNDNSVGQPEYLIKVNADCWERIFDLLSLRDIFAMSETCKRMRKMAGYYFREYVPEILCRWIANNGVFIGYPTSIRRTDFSEYISKLMVYDYLEHFLYAKEYCALKSLHLRSIELTDTQIDFVKNLLKNIENIDLKRCTIYGDIYEKFLKYCSKLKRLRLHDILFEPEDTANSFFQRTYSTLEYLDFSTLQFYPRNTELTNFLNRNTGLKHFGVSNLFLWTNRAAFIQSNIELDTFSIYTELHHDSEEFSASEFVNLLKTLYERGFFKSLTFKMIETDELTNYQELIDELATLDAFEVLITLETTDLSRLIHLKELWLTGYFYATNLELLARNLTKLERIHFQNASTDDIRPFFQHCKRLKAVKVYEMRGGSLLEDGAALNLDALNRDREILGISRKVKICTEERIYLATKNQIKNLGSDRVDIARWDSDEWHTFDPCYFF